jgi:hypothetical protein
MKEKPLPERPSHPLLTLGILIMCAGIAISALFFWALETNTSDFGSIGDGLGIVYGGFPITLVGLIVFLVGLVRATRNYLLAIGILIMFAGVVISLMFLWAVKMHSPYPNFAGMSGGRGIIYGGLPLLLFGVIVSLSSLLITRRRK